MLDGVIILGAFIVKSQTETVAVLACLIQSDSYIAFEFHLYQAATAIHRTEQSACVAFGNYNLLDFEVGIVEVSEVYKPDIGKQIGSSAGVLQFLAEVLVGYLLLTVTVLSVGEPAIYRVAFLCQCFLYLCGV